MTRVLLPRSMELLAVTAFPVNVILRNAPHSIVDPAAAAIVQTAAADVVPSHRGALDVPVQVNGFVMVVVVALGKITLFRPVNVNVAIVAAPEIVK